MDAEKGKKKRIIKLVATTAIITLLTTHGIKLVKGKNAVHKILENHSESIFHDENIVAHRGFSGLEPDNSYESVELALNTPCVDMIEIDVRKTKDNQIILHHDSIINFNDTFTNIEDINLEEIDTNTLKRKYPFLNFAAYPYDDTLFLAERFLNRDAEDREIIKLVDFINWYSFDKPLIIDVKMSEVSREYMDELNRILGNHKDNVYIQSENYDFLKEMMKIYGDYKYFFIVNSNDDIEKMTVDFDGFTIRSRLLSKVKIIDNKTYLVYTINSSRKYLRLLENKKYNEDMYIITDNPDYICAISESKQLKKVYKE